MNDERNIEDVLQRALPSAPRGPMEAALDRVYVRLQSEPAGHRTPEAVTDVERGPRLGWWWTPVLAGAAIALAIWVGISVKGQGAYALLETSDVVYRVADGERTPLRLGDRIAMHETVRSNGAGAVVALPDGSRVEMRADSELALERADDGLRIRLHAGSIIVNAAKQRTGHLYVQTRDMTVSVIGTVFLVNAEPEGSRVAVIEGEVEVREGKVEKRLRPGEQVATSPAMVTRPVKEEIAWSRNANAHRAILESFEKGMATTAGPLTRLQVPGAVSAAAQSAAQKVRREFEEASVRECDPDNLPPAPPGARGGGANSFYMSPGRTYVLCMTLGTIIRTAYGYGPMDLEYVNLGSIGPAGRGLTVGPVYGLGVENGRRVRGGPDWIHEERYTIEAVAEGASDAETMRGPMLRALLEDRFQLKAHVETEQTPAFNLVVAPGGLKIKPVDESACEAFPPPDVPAVRIPRPFKDVRNGQKPNCGLGAQPNGPNHVMVGGAAPLSGLTTTLGGPLGGVRIFDKTGIADRFNFVLEFVWDENTPGQRRVQPRPDDPTDIPRAATIFTALEEQLGLRLEPTKASREFIVIDSVQKPSAN